ncbi:MAG: deoxyribonuclease IV [Acidobacteriaceae bacterium]
MTTLIGSHVSIAGGLFNAPANAAASKDETFQIFSRSPHGGILKPITEEDVKKFRQAMEERGFTRFYIHTPYFINLSSDKNNIYFGSISVIRQELERGSQIGATAIMTHLGSFGELSEKAGLNKVVEGLVKVLDGYKGKTQLLLEISAGAGKIVGDTFEELAAIIFDDRLKGLDIGICLDTCHLFASGYDVSNQRGVAETFERFDKVLGFDKLKLMHANDSKGALGSRLDRHEHIGMGKIGLQGFEALMDLKRLREVDWILETPREDEKIIIRNVETLKRMRDSKGGV